MAGIERFGRGQKQLAAVLRDAKPPSSMPCVPTPKPIRQTLTELSDRLNWELRIFDERQKSLRFVCEVPVLIEQRLFALARAISE